MGSVEETRTGEEEKQQMNKAQPPLDLNDFAIIKEGEAEILMHAKNEVFYNKTQVNNRDLLIAVTGIILKPKLKMQELFIELKAKLRLNIMSRQTCLPFSFSFSFSFSLPVTRVSFLTSLLSSSLKEQEAINFLEKNMKNDPEFSYHEIVQTAISALQSVLQEDFKANEIEVGVVQKENPVFHVLSTEEIDEHLTAISESD